MGACILCGKSAGPFYSLHKKCYSKYNESNQIIADYLIQGLQKDDSSQLASKITQHIENCGFIAEAQKRTLNRALEYFVSHYADKEPLTQAQIKSWINLLGELPLDETLFVNQYFLTQQYNLSALNELKNACLPESNRHPANYAIKLYEQEELWWCFDNSEIEQDNPVEDKRQWSVMMHLMNSMFAKNRKRSLEKKSLGDGKLLITNKRIYLESDQYTQELAHREIYSVTPIKNGVRIQSKVSSAKPQAFLCEDGRLLFAFIKHAQAQHQ